MEGGRSGGVESQIHSVLGPEQHGHLEMPQHIRGSAISQSNMYVAITWVRFSHLEVNLGTVDVRWFEKIIYVPNHK